MLVTPEWAAEKLQHNTRNRALSDLTVQAYALDMKNGNWLLNHQGIAFNQKGDLIDGQHRLSAVVTAGVPVMMNVTTGCKDMQKNGVLVDIMDTVDRGKVRGVGAQLALFHGITAGNQVAATCTSIARLLVSAVRRLTTPQTLQVLKLYRDDIEAVFSVKDSIRKLPAYIAAPIAVVHNSFPEAAIGFAESYCSLENLKAHSPVMALVKWIDNHRHASGMKRTASKVVASCLYHYVQGNSIQKLYASEDAMSWLLAAQKTNIKKLTDLLVIPTQENK